MKRSLNNINRIAIVGAPGTGKTTLAKNLGKIYKLPILHLDHIHYKENWILRDTEERNKIIIEESQKEKWILDGTFIDTLQERVDKADLVIFLDFPRTTQLKGIFERRIKHMGKKKIEIPKLDMSFILYVFTYNKERRKHIVDILSKKEKSKIIVFQKRSDLDNWLRNKFIENNLPVDKINK